MLKFNDDLLVANALQWLVGKEDNETLKERTKHHSFSAMKGARGAGEEGRTGKNYIARVG